MKTWQIILGGVGGQGLVTSGSLLGEAASIYSKKNVAMHTAYGAEARGTFTKSDVIISSSEIDFPEVETPNFVLALMPVAYDNYVDILDENAVLLYDSSLIEEKPSKAKQIGLPLRELAAEVGNVGATNLTALGAIAALTDVVTPEALEWAITRKFAKKEAVLKKNIDAMWAGVRAGKEKG